MMRGLDLLEERQKIIREVRDLKAEISKLMEEIARMKPVFFAACDYINAVLAHENAEQAVKDYYWSNHFVCTYGINCGECTACRARKRIQEMECEAELLRQHANKLLLALREAVHKEETS